MMSSSRNIKVAHLSTYQKGGAGLAAFRTHSALQKFGVESHFISTATFPSSQRLLEKIHRKVFESKRTLNKYFDTKRGARYELFSAPFAPFDLLQSPIVQNADLIHLHWISGFLDIPSFFKRIDKPIVWTLHDKSPFLGGFHYENDLIENQKLLGKKNASVLASKIKAYSDADRLEIVCPSESIMEKSRVSTAFHHRTHHLVRNTLNLQEFSPVDRNVAREALSLPSNKKILLFVAENISNRWKGLSVLKNALNQIESDDLFVITVGSGDHSESYGNHPQIHFNTVSSDRLLSLIYSAADVFVTPTLEDNLPNVVLESMACGTPIIGHGVGGIPEIVKKGRTGWTVDFSDPNGLQKAIEDFLKGQPLPDRDKIRQEAIELFDEAQHAKQLLDIYHQILS